VGAVNRKLQSLPIVSLDGERYPWRRDQTTIPGVDLYPTEDRAAYAQFREEVFLELSPNGPVEEEIVIRICRLLWRLNHLDIFWKADDASNRYHNGLREFYGDTYSVCRLYEDHSYLEYFLKKFQQEIARLRGEVSEQPKDFGLAPKLTEEIKEFQTKIARCGEEIEDLKRDRGLAAPSTAPDGAGSFDKLLGSIERLNNASGGPMELNSILEKEIGVIHEWMKQTFGRSRMMEIKAQRDREKRDGTPLELAFFATAITVDKYAEELKITEAIEEALARNLRMLQDLKRQKRREWERKNNRNWLLPPYIGTQDKSLKEKFP